MTDDSPNDLNTGHFGIPAYDLEHSRWAFVRTANGANFRQLDQWRTAIPPAIRYPPPHIPQSLRTARRLTKSLARELPELLPATDHVSEFEAVSAAATAALDTYNVTVGQLMSFGTVTPMSIRSWLAKDVVALPSGEGGNILRLQVLSKEKRGWGLESTSDTLCYLDCSSWKGASGFWNQDATAIQQVCFAQTEKPGSFLAVRLPQRVALFRPTLRRRPVAAVKSCLYDLPPSVIDIRPFHSVWIADTGNVPHVDVAFNPHYQRQFAIADQKSGWSVWDIDGTRRGYTVKRSAFGNMVAEESSDGQTKPLGARKEDGWARVMWVGDANTLIVCNRRQMELIDLRQPTRSLRVPQVVNWHPTKNTLDTWILDVKRHPLLNERLFFVLTSTRLYLYAVAPMEDQLRTDLGDTAASVVLSWTHFRGAEDLTLQLHVQSVSDEETVMFVYSRLNSLITLYRLVEQPSVGAPYRSFGPSTLALDNFDNADISSKEVLGFNISRVHFQNPMNDIHGLGHEYMNRDIHFYQVSAIFKDLSVAQTMLCTFGRDSTDGTLLDIEPTSWAATVKPVVGRSTKTVESDDDFVEPDGPTGTRDPLLRSVFQHPKRYHNGNDRHFRDVYNFTNLYEIISSNRPLELYRASTLPESIDVVALVEEIRWRLDREENVEPFTLGTLHEYAEAAVLVDDIDEASAKLQDLSLQESFASSLEPRRIASDVVSGLSSGESQEYASLSLAYDLVLQSWLASLSERIPARVRQNKERIARRLATALVLASTRIRQSRDWPAVQVHSKSQTPATRSSPPPFSSQSDWPTQSSQPSDSGSMNTQTSFKGRMDNPLARLSKHLHMSSVHSPELPPSISQVLSHWDLGTDPFAYDWEATERAFADELELEQEGMPKKRERERRKRERQMKRQKRENQLFTGRAESSKVESQPQLQRSSPGPIPQTISSQVAASSQGQPFVVQSQVEPGRHGGRPAKKKKAKSRMSGF